MAEARTEHGTIDYEDTGTGEPLVFLHGYLAGPELWDPVVELLHERHRCIRPLLPLGAHHHPMAPDAELDPPALARLVVSFLDALGLERATLVGNDTGGAIAQLVAAHHPERVERLVLTNGDAYEVFPPRLFSYLKLAARTPGAMAMLAQSMRIRAVRRLPIAFGRLSATRIPDEILDAWVEPVRRDRGVRADLRKVTVGLHRKHTLEAAERLRAFDRPVLFAWGADDRLFPLALAERLAADVPDGRVVPIAGARTFVSLDAPEALAETIASFVASPA